MYPNIKYIHESLYEDISVIINCYNLVLPIFTLTFTLINLNNNLNNIYNIINYNTTKIYLTRHIMTQSSKYKQIMKRKQQNTTKQIKLMLNENCIMIIVNNKGNYEKIIWTHRIEKFFNQQQNNVETIFSKVLFYQKFINSNMTSFYCTHNNN